MIVKRVKIIQGVQEKIDSIFHAQVASFLDGVSEEIAFGGDWKPDPDELLFIDKPDEVAIIFAAMELNPISLPTVDAKNFVSEGIRALFIKRGGRILMQSFTAQQILARRFSLMLDGDTFKEITEPAFTLDNYLVAIIEDDKLKFKSFFNIKRIFSLSQFYHEATDLQVEEFCSHPSLAIEDISDFKEIADEGIRKLVHAIAKTGILDEHSVDDIAAKANSLGLDIAVHDGKLVVPPDRKKTKQLLRFLDDGIYAAALSAKRYVTNSKRPF